jgi:hypothetical protein
MHHHSLVALPVVCGNRRYNTLRQAMMDPKTQKASYTAEALAGLGTACVQVVVTQASGLPLGPAAIHITVTCYLTCRLTCYWKVR